MILTEEMFISASSEPHSAESQRPVKLLVAGIVCTLASSVINNCLLKSVRKQVWPSGKALGW